MSGIRVRLPPAAERNTLQARKDEVPHTEHITQPAITVLHHPQHIANHDYLDIDDRRECKHAQLSLRQQGIRQLEHATRSPENPFERADIKSGNHGDPSEITESILDIQKSRIAALEAEVRALTEQYEYDVQGLSAQEQGTSARLSDTQTDQNLRLRGEEDSAQWVQDRYGPNGEVLLLRQSIKAKDKEINMLKMQLIGQAANSSSDLVWQASVNEAVRRERVKDAFVIEAMRDALVKHGGRPDNLPRGAIDGDQFGSREAKDAFEIDALRERLMYILGEKD